jgi:hypothetical protein
MMTYYVLDLLTTTHGEAVLPTSTARRGGLQEIGMRGRSPGLGSGDLPDKACSWQQEASYSFAMLSLGQATLRLDF